MLNKKSLSSLSISAVVVTLLTSPPQAFAQFGTPVEFADVTVCVPGLIDVPEALRGQFVGGNAEQETVIEADEIGAGEEGLIELSGNAQITQGSRGLYADVIEYDQEAYMANAEGNVVFYTSNGDEIKADSMNIEVDTFIGDGQGINMKFIDNDPFLIDRNHENFIEDYTMFAPLLNKIEQPEEGLEEDEAEEGEEVFVEKTYYQRARAVGDSITFEGADFHVLQDATMTTCPDGNNDVTISAKEMQLDHTSGVGIAKSMVLRIKNVPVFYMPTISFPINDQRKTGFLFPIISKEDESGWGLGIPYYINIAPTMDATLAPKILTERGFQLYSEFRYLGKKTKGAIKAEYLPSDKLFEDQDRYAIGFDHNQQFGKNWRATVDLQKVSDSDYLRDFENNVNVVASSYVPQRANITHNTTYTNFTGRVQQYESVNDEIDEANLPYDILPELKLKLKPQDIGPVEIGVESEYIEYSHNNSEKLTGSRLQIKPHLTLPIERIYGYLKPKVSLQNISYSLSNNEAGNSPSATIPIYNVDGKLIFERLFKRGETPYYQTLEPRVFYVNIPEETDQNAFPNFDSSESTPNSFGNFFRENRFYGGDRVGDTEQISFGLTSRVVNDDDGKQKLKASIGQVFYLKDRTIRINPEAEPDTTTHSDFIAELTANINDDWNFTSFARWDNEEQLLSSYRLSANYSHSIRRRASLAYNETKSVNNTQQYMNFSFDTPLSPRWQIEGRASYSISDSELRSSSVGISYDGCCWAVRAKTEEYFDGEGDKKNRILFTWELDDLGQLRSTL